MSGKDNKAPFAVLEVYKEPITSHLYSNELTVTDCGTGKVLKFQIQTPKEHDEQVAAAFAALVAQAKHLSFTL